MIEREALDGDPLSAVALARATDATVQGLKAALVPEAARARQLAKQLAQCEARARKVARSHEEAKDRYAIKVSKMAGQLLVSNPPTAEQIRAFEREEWARERRLARELKQRESQVAKVSEALARSQSRVDQLERALALAMAQARTAAWERARSPRVRAIAIARSIGRLLQGRSGLWDGIVRNLYLGMRVVALLVWMLPKADRPRWKDESFSELEDLKQESAPLLGDAFRIAARTPSLALVLWAGAWRRSPAARWLPQLKPAWMGVGTTTATFCTGIAGIGQHPTEWQMRTLVAASLLTGVLALTGSSKGRRPRRRGRRRKR